MLHSVRMSDIRYPVILLGIRCIPSKKTSYICVRNGPPMILLTIYIEFFNIFEY